MCPRFWFSRIAVKQKLVLMSYTNKYLLPRGQAIFLAIVRGSHHIRALTGYWWDLNLHKA